MNPTPTTKNIDPRPLQKVLTSEQVQEMDRKRIEDAKKASIGKFKPEHLQKALNDLFDVQERAMLQFILLGDLAKCCKENRLEPCGEIEVAMPINQLTKEVKSLFESTWKFAKETYGYSYLFSPPTLWDIKIPIRIYIYKNKFKFFENPNRVWAFTENITIPNPWQGYWNARHLIKGKLAKQTPLSDQPL